MTQISKEYAEALFALACEAGKEEEMRTQLEAMSAAVYESEDFYAFLSSPAIPLDARVEAIDKAFSGTAHEYAVSFLKLLCEKRRMALLSEAVKAYGELCDARAHVAKAKVISAVPLTEAEREALVKSLRAKSGGDIELECEVDASILGGLIVELDGRVADGSLRRKLSEVKEVIL